VGGGPREENEPCAWQAKKKKTASIRTLAPNNKRHCVRSTSETGEGSVLSIAARKKKEKKKLIDLKEKKKEKKCAHLTEWRTTPIIHIGETAPAVKGQGSLFLFFPKTKRGFGEKEH